MNDIVDWRRSIETLLSTQFRTISALAAEINDVIISINDDSQKQEAFKFLIANNGLIERIRPSINAHPREFTQTHWEKLVKTNLRLVKAIIDTAFDGAPPIDDVARSLYKNYAKLESDEERDFFVSVLLVDDQTPYPDLPPTTSIKGLTDQEFKSTYDSMMREINIVRFILKNDVFSLRSQVAEVIYKLLETFENNNQKIAFLTFVLSSAEERGKSSTEN